MFMEHLVVSFPSDSCRALFAPESPFEAQGAPEFFTQYRVVNELFEALIATMLSCYQGHGAYASSSGVDQHTTE